MKVHNLTVCDLVRVEDNGKFLLIGVYSNGVLLSGFPSGFTLNVWLLLEAEKLGASQASFRARIANSDNPLIQVEGDIMVNALEDWTPMSFGGNVVFTEPCELVLEARLNSDTWEHLRTLQIRQMPSGHPMLNSLPNH